MPAKILRKQLHFSKSWRTEIVSVDVAQLVDSLYADMVADGQDPEVQRYIQLLMQQLEYVGVPS